MVVGERGFRLRGGLVGRVCCWGCWEGLRVRPLPSLRTMGWSEGWGGLMELAVAVEARSAVVVSVVAGWVAEVVFGFDAAAVRLAAEALCVVVHHSAEAFYSAEAYCSAGEVHWAVQSHSLAEEVTCDSPVAAEQKCSADAVQPAVFAVLASSVLQRGAARPAVVDEALSASSPCPVAARHAVVR